MLMLAVGREEVESRVDWLFDETATCAVDRASVSLGGEAEPGLASTRQLHLCANRESAAAEMAASAGWWVGRSISTCRCTAASGRTAAYGAIIFDMPPRMTLGSINALVASHAFVVPTILDALSVEAVGQFLANVKAIKSDLGLDIDLAGIVGMMTRQAEPSDRERRGLALAREGGKHLEGKRGLRLQDDTTEESGNRRCGWRGRGISVERGRPPGNF